MTVDVKKGDRIRATREDVTVEGPVGWVSDNGSIIQLRKVEIYLADGWEIEILPKPFPTEPGYYVREDADLSNDDLEIYNLVRDGEWFVLDADKESWAILDSEDVPTDLVPLVKGER